MNITRHDGINWLRASLVVQAILAFYFQLFQWFPLGNWNHQCPSGDDIACGLGHQGISVSGFKPLIVQAFSGQLSALNALYCLGVTIPFWAFWLAYAKGWRRAMWIQAGFYSLWLALQMGWWFRYIFGRTDAQITRYQNVFGRATQLLPSFGRHLPPDGLHLVLQILLISVLVTAVVGLRKSADHFAG